MEGKMQNIFEQIYALSKLYAMLVSSLFPTPDSNFWYYLFRKFSVNQGCVSE